MDKDTNNYDAMEAELKTRFGLLPKEIQDVITSSDYQTKLFELSKKYKLTYEQLGVLEFHTTLTLLGALPPGDYEKTVTNDLNKKTEEVTPIIEEIKEQIFKPIRTAMMNLYAAPAEDSDEAENTFEKSGVSIENQPLKTTPSVSVSENRDSMLASIENPAPSAPRVLNEIKQAPASSMPLSKSASASIPVPRAPYAGGAPTMDAVKQPIPMQAKPAGDILAGKLGGTFSVPAKETDHSIKNVGTAPAPKAGGDSYREPIE